MKKKITFSCLLGILMFMTLQTSAQIGISTDKRPVDRSAGLDVNFTDRGVLFPRMTFAQRNAIQNPAEGLMVYCTNCNPDETGLLSIFQGGSWKIIYHNCYPPNTPTEGIHNPDSTQITWNWNKNPTASGYKWNTIEAYATAIDLGNCLSKTETGLEFNTTYTRFVWAYNACGYTHQADTLTSTTCGSPDTPVAGTQIPAAYQIIWNWNSVPIALGYKWNTSNNYSTAMDMGTSVTKTETGLYCNTSYARYVWAYNACGHSTPDSLTQTTSICPQPCETSITINHTAGAVAPVTKTVTYDIVSNTTGFPNGTCWITSNLGADHQATAVDDTSEASAGWYWQFNRKQGYKHDGTTRTPNSAWINAINENSDWVDANDPCAIELGAGWHIPTNTEWTNISGGWTNWDGPWNSVLKIHAAGYLDWPDGSLNFRSPGDSFAHYWTNNQYNATYSWYLPFGPGIFELSNYNKADGMSVRCIKAQ